ncbi:uncharacterized protein TrAFT101_006347 [Trichoderma asperellum]|uniref:FAD-binding domain-containing protein n=1 Tax=Trichoderma asperellum (strain ATCC 204424 / CBS 433.97 / NBRC 101777) TaxID=1042311 RepID=A0A2T3Z8R5_TRIA4|nr:hypothetical protein M441DRAFT_58621 [Trichoderma asperellum CBS 433.97]PTB41203.1 hypothetical protein M441DRAFT_58621 [Trichoderma asperellum CBS 433.97]UKZ91364.1 hypothetical protein TrAFT101_006347 [Trichoderma asperellum]WVH32675.1 FAD binding domain protein [Trichoderma asperellum]
MAFKVIIIGGGPVGLFLANSLQAAGIDYALFEKRSAVAPTTAFGIFLMPQVTRMFEQLGLLESLKKVSHQMTGMVHRNANAEQLSQDQDYAAFCQIHGYPVVVTDRASLSQVFLSGLNKPEEHIFTRKDLTNIVIGTDGVTAEFADGTSHEGSVIIGADGIWSSVRDQLRKITPDGLFLENPFTASFTGVFGRGPLFDDIPSGQGAEIHGDDWVIQAFPSQKETHLFIYKRIETCYDRVPFTTNVPEDIIAEFANVKLTSKVAFKDLWDKRFAGGAANFEEGVVELWHWDRVALVGDAAHKMNPKWGVGANIGMEAAACLTNKLAALLKNNSKPSTQDLSQLFGSYQGEIEGKAGVWERISKSNLDSATRRGGPQIDAMRQMGIIRAPGIISKAYKLENAPFKAENPSQIPWLH